MTGDVLVSERAIQDIISKRLSGNDTIVLMVIGSLGHTVKMSISDVATATPLSRPTVSRSIAALEALGYIEIERSVNQNMAGEIIIVAGVACKKPLQAKVRSEKIFTSAEQAETPSELGEPPRLEKIFTSAEQATKGIRSIPISKDLEPISKDLDPECRRIAELFADGLHRIDPKMKFDVEKSLVHIDRLHRIDNRSFADIEKVVLWLHADNPDKDATFWQTNILSTTALRRQFSRLFVKISNGTRNTPKALSDLSEFDGL